MSSELSVSLRKRLDCELSLLEAQGCAKIINDYLADCFAKNKQVEIGNFGIFSVMETIEPSSGEIVKTLRFVPAKNFLRKVRGKLKNE